MRRILYVYLSPSSFVLDDLAHLRARYHVRAFHFDADAARNPAGLLRTGARQAQWLRRELPHADAVYGWFADYHLALPVWAAQRTGVPVAVALGGFESNVLPALDYGVMQSRWRAPLARAVLRGASHLLPVAEALLAAENHFGAAPDVLHNGVRALVPGLSTPATVLPTGYDPEAWPMGSVRRAPSVVCVAFADRARTVRVKGLDLLVAAARHLPEVPFRLIGVSGDGLAALGAVPANVRVEGPLPREALASAYNAASLFALLSRSEGLPNVLCEAMLCGAVPVGSAVGGIPEAIGEAGFVVHRPDPARIAERLRHALDAADTLRVAARARIVRHYGAERRRAGLYGVLDRLMEARPHA